MPGGASKYYRGATSHSAEAGLELGAEFDAESGGKFHPHSSALAVYEFHMDGMRARVMGEGFLDLDELELGGARMLETQQHGRAAIAIDGAGGGLERANLGGGEPDRLVALIDAGGDGDDVAQFEQPAMLGKGLVPDHNLDAAGKVFEDDDGEWLRFFLGEFFLDADERAGDLDGAPILGFAERG